MNNDSTLLRRYAEDGSNDAFAELVGRHLDLVFSAAMREVRGDFARAQDITQTVFTALARKASILHHRKTLVGWLHLSVHHAAAQLMRTEQRRQKREHEASTMQEHSNATTGEGDWERLRPVLNEVVQDLGEVDRDAVLLRFYQQRPLADVGATLRLSTDAAQKRIERALEKMRAGLVKRGITSTSVALGLLLQNNAVAAAPIGLLGTITQGALAATTGTGGGAAALFLLLTKGKISLGIAAAVVLAGGATIAWEQRSNSKLSGEISTLKQDNRQIALLRAESAQARSELEALRAVQAENERLKNALGASATAVEKRPQNFGRAPAITADQAKQWIAAANDPKVLARLVATGRVLTLKRYSYFIDQLKLSPERTEALIRLLDDKRQVPLDVAVASLLTGVDPRDDPSGFETQLTIQRAEIEKKIRSFLGNDLYPQYLDYNRQLNQESTLTRLGEFVAGTEHALTSDQTVKLQQLLQTHRKMSPQMISEAQSFLSTEQIDALQEVFRAKDDVKNRIPEQLSTPSP